MLIVRNYRKSTLNPVLLLVNVFDAKSMLLILPREAFIPKTTYTIPAEERVPVVPEGAPITKSL